MSRSRSISWGLVLITLLVYLPVMRNGFLNFDDKDYVTENPMVQRGITWPGIQWAFTSWHASNWHPLTWLSHMVDCEVFRLNPAGHHLTSLLLHVANVWLLFQLWLRLTNVLWGSAMVAALFAWHPLHVESVAWIAERKDVLSTCFALLTLLSYVRYAQNTAGNPAVRLRASPPYWLALLWFALGLMAKPMLVTLPFVMLLLDFWPLQRNRSRWQLLFEKCPFFLLSAASSLVTVLAQRAEAIAPLAKYSMPLRLENILAAYVGYLYKTVWPEPLAVFYPLIPPAWPVVLWAAILLLGISLWVWRSSSQPYLLVGWLWYLGTLVPVIGWVQVGDQALADRYTYFPLIGIFVAGVWALRDWARGVQLPHRCLAWAGILTAAVCVGVTEHQLSYWRSSETLFAHALAVTPDNASARLNLGEAFQEENRPNDALEQYKIALRLDPRRHELYHNIGRLLNDEGRWDEASNYCRLAVELDGRSPLSHTGLGVVLAELGHYDEALNEFSQSARLDPLSAVPPFQTGRIWLKLGRDADAVAEFDQAVRLEPGNVPMLLYIARVLATDQNSAGRDGVQALRLARQAAQLAGEQPALLDTLAMAYAETGHFDESVQLAQKALAATLAGGSQEDITNLQQQLERYQHRQPARIFFGTK